MKRGWMKLWICASLLPAGLCFAASSPAAQRSLHRANETLLAGLRPGRDTLTIAEKRFKSKKPLDGQDSGIKEWRDECSGRAIRLELNAKSVIQSVTITTLESQEGKCGEKRLDFLDPKNWVTGEGLRIGDSQDRILGFYG